MRAAVLNSIPGRLDIEDVEIGEPGPREVLVRTVAAGLCHSDLHFMEGKYPFPCPAVLGHESAGVVEAVGSMVHLRPAGRPRDHLPVGVLRALFTVHRRSPHAVREQGDRTRPPAGRDRLVSAGPTARWSISSFICRRSPR